MCRFIFIFSVVFLSADHLHENQSADLCCDNCSEIKISILYNKYNIYYIMLIHYSAYIIVFFHFNIVKNYNRFHSSFKYYIIIVIIIIFMHASLHYVIYLFLLLCWYKSYRVKDCDFQIC